MKVYVYPYMEKLTDNYHSGGGAVVMTDRDPKIVLQEHRQKTHDSDNADVPCPQVEFPDDEPPPTVFESDATEEKVFIFPDAGCC